MPPEERLSETFDETEGVFAEKETNGLLPSIEKEEVPEIEYDETFENPPFFSIMSAYLCLFLLVVFGHFRDLLRRWGFDKTMDASEFGNEVRLLLIIKYIIIKYIIIKFTSPLLST